MNALAISTGPRPRSPRIDATRREQLLGAFDQSGLSAAAFARQQGLSYWTFCSWRKDRIKTKRSPDFVQVAVEAAAATGPLVIEVGAHARICLRSQSQIALAARLLLELSGGASC